jgi:predicted nucleic acid-binding protein
MMVVDASVAVALVLPDEQSPSILTGESLVGSIAPTLWPYEVLSALRSAERAGRISQGDLINAASALARLPIEFVHPDYQEVISTSRACDLSVYDASYLALAARYGAPLATLDSRLASAAATLGIATTQ